MNDSARQQQLVALLDDYLSRLQHGENPDRQALIRDNPELEPTLLCLEALESMAPQESDPGTASELPSDFVEFPCEFGSYELLEEIGRGGMGVVYKARQPSLDRIVAIKMILASHLASTEHVRRFRAEAKAAARLRHSHIVDIHEVGQIHGQHYFAMQFVDGKSLADRVAEGRIELEAAVRIVAAVARAVAYLHRQGLVHRDLKPSNILIDEEGQPHVTDFGLAKGLQQDSELTATGVIAGTPSYMSPEQAAGRRSEIGPLSDVYSLGAILYELLTGRPPFREENPLDTLMQVLNREPTLPRELNPKIPGELQLICLKCLNKARQDRYPSADALADDLEHFLKGEALTAKPPNLGRRLQRWARREPALASRLAVIGIFFMVENWNYTAGRVAWDFHRKMLLLMAVWGGSSFVLQQFLKSSRWSIPAQFVWGFLDSVLLLAALLIADGVGSGLIVCYPMLVVGSGLWFRVRFVSFMTAMSLLSYGFLVFDFRYLRWEELRVAKNIPYRPDRYLMFAVMLVVLGTVVAYLVHRVRTLSRYYGAK
jgi:serine/threonine-protein kinase